MQSLRHARLLARFVLAWLVLAVGVAAASPLVKPQAAELICASGGAIILIVQGEDGASSASSHTLDCPLCATVSAPPVAASLPVAPPSSLTHALRPIPAAHIAGRTAAPLPPRGPPAFS